MKQETPTVSRPSEKLRHRPSRYGLSCRDSKWQWQETPKVSRRIFFFSFFWRGNKKDRLELMGKRCPTKGKIGERAKWTGRCKDGCGEELTTPTTPNPTPPITTHGCKLSTLWLSDGRSLVRQLLTKDTPTSRTAWPWRFPRSWTNTELEPKGLRTIWHQR